MASARTVVEYLASLDASTGSNADAETRLAAYARTGETEITESIATLGPALAAKVYRAARERGTCTAMEDATDAARLAYTRARTPA